uniref:NADH-ubiquinone oxidoreductase chain 2 n=1 Tax=Anterhynchium abdominale TaxID=1589846 RepID=A0A6M9AU14_9HYME|nr:NADH dehydrogenase subunit 2 [Anterhynchium abdominale]
MNKSMNSFNSPMNFLIMVIMIILNFLSMMTSNLNYLWLLLEINLLLFFYLMAKTINYTIMPTFYFIQSLTSLLFIFTFNSSYLLGINSYSMEFYLIDLLFFLSISMKLGLFPFTWLPPMLMENMNWNLIFLFSTFQKFIPFMVIKNYPLHFESWLLMMCLCSILISTIKALMEPKIKSMLAYSSINNTAWMIILIKMNTMMFGFYFIMYVIITQFVVSFFNESDAKYFSDLMVQYSFKMYLFFIVTMFLLSMIPPMTSFIIKLNTAFIFIVDGHTMPTSLYILASLLSIMMYMGILIKFFYLQYIKLKIKFMLSKQDPKPLFILIFLALITFFVMLYFMN